MVSTTLSTGKKGEIWSLRSFRSGVTEGSEREFETAAVRENSSCRADSSHYPFCATCIETFILVIATSEIKELQTAEDGRGGPSFITKMSVADSKFT